MSAGEKLALERLAQNFRLRREELRLDQAELALKADMHRTQISYLESGKRGPRVMTLIKLCGALEVSPNEMLEGIVWDKGDLYKGAFQVSDAEEKP